MQGFTRVPKGLQRYKDYRSIQRFTWVYKGIQGFTWDNKGFQGIAWVYKGNSRV